MLYKCFMGSSTKIYNHRKISRTCTTVKEKKTYEAIFIIDNFSIYLCAWEPFLHR